MFFFTVSLLLYLECAPLSLYFFFISSPRFSHFSSSPPSGSIPRSLQEADCADLDSELLICSADVKRGNVHNGQARGLLRSVLHHCLAPLSRVFLCSGEEKKERKKKKGRQQLLGDLLTCWEIAEKKKIVVAVPPETDDSFEEEQNTMKLFFSVFPQVGAGCSRPVCRPILRPLVSVST